MTSVKTQSTLCELDALGVASSAGYVVTTASEYRRFLEESLRWADQARSEKERSAFLQMARTWYEAALLAERSLGLVCESRELLDSRKKPSKIGPTKISSPLGPAK